MTLEELESLIKDLTKRPISLMVERQIEKMSNDGISYKEIGRAIYYFYEVKHGDTSSIDRYGIGIVRNILNEANSYFDNIRNKQEIQRQAAERVKNTSLQEVVVRPYRRSFSKEEVDIDGL